jgi:hypothetical protein
MAAPTSRENAVVKNYAGLVTNAGPQATDPADGAAEELVNLTVTRRGELAARPGFTVVSFDTE